MHGLGSSRYMLTWIRLQNCSRKQFPRIVKELLQSLNPQQHLPNLSEKSLLVPLNCQKVLERLLSIAEPQYVSRNLDSVLLKGLEVKRLGKAQRKSLRAKRTWQCNLNLKTVTMRAKKRRWMTRTEKARR